MRVLVLYAHPVEDSYAAALHRTVVEGLTDAGHEVDDCDLYAEDFDPRLSREERLAYHEEGANQAAVQPYVERLRAAEGLVLCFPVWNYGYPAILKGFFDRVFLPGVSFTIVEGKVRPTLQHIRYVAAVTTYGGTRLRTMVMGDPPRKLVCRALRATIRPAAPVRYLALYDMNRADAARRERFLARVRGEIAAA